MARSDRARRGRVSVGRSRALAVLAIVALLGVATLSGILAPGPAPDVQLPVLGDGDRSAQGSAPTPNLSADGPDADGDGLTDAVEAELGTDPHDRDTDGDGYPDGMEVGCGDRLPDADPLHQDVYVEVDSVDGAALDPATVDLLETAFAAAPVENPDGEDGIDVHLVRSDGDLPENGPINNRARMGEYNDVTDYRTAHFDRAEYRYHYLLVVSDAAYNGDRTFAGAGHRGTAVVEHYDRERVMASLIMHELGHSFGIAHARRGVDADRYDLEEYHSVMNYNGIYEVYTYSDGTDDLGRDEWEYVAERRHRPPLDCPDEGSCASLCSRTA